MGSRPRCGGGAGEALQAEGAGEVVEYIFFLSGKTLSTLYSTRPRSGCLTDLQPLQQQQNSVNKANNTVAGKTNNSGKLGSPSSNDNTASPMDSASVTTPAVLTKEARGRVTRSSLGKAPLSLKSCEQVIWTLNIESYLFVFLFGLLLYNVMFFPAAKRVQHTGRSPRERSRSNKRLLAPNPAQNYQVGKYFRTNLGPQPTSSQTLKHRDRHCLPHELCCRVKEPGLCNPLQKLKQISLTPKKTIRAKRNKTTNKRWDTDRTAKTSCMYVKLSNQHHISGWPWAAVVLARRQVLPPRLANSHKLPLLATRWLWPNIKYYDLFAPTALKPQY